jgi:arylsulfatase A-like enzyme
MNIILVLIDSLNRHQMNAYAKSPIKTPNLDAFAAKSFRFDNHFVGSLPCMPARREIFSGQKEMMWRPWGPLEPSDVPLPHLLADAGLTTALITDHYHYWEEPANGYLQSFQSVHLVRGHEIDFWNPPLPADEPLPAFAQAIDNWRPTYGRRYYANVKDFKREEDFFPAKVFSGAAEWLRRNERNRPFYLHVESFDVHEPFHVPEPYFSMYNDDTGTDDFTVWPPYQDAKKQAAYFSKVSEKELRFVRSQYAGKMTMVDTWFGHLMAELDRQDLWNDTMVIVTTDHGHDLGERKAFGKSYPHYDSHANIPLFVWHPAFSDKTRKVTGLTQTVDLYATVLDAAGAAPLGGTHSRSWLPLLKGENVIRPALTYGTFGQGICVTDGDWSLFKSPVDDRGLFIYSSVIYRPLVVDSQVGSQIVTDVTVPADSGNFVPGSPFPQWKTPMKIAPRNLENFLFNRRTDPGQTQNLWATDVPQRERMLGILRDILKKEGAPPEQWERLGL